MKRLLITGGGGFLGRAVIKHVQEQGLDLQVLVYSRDEAKHAAVRRKYPDARCVIGDILDTQRLLLVMGSVDYVIHAAALKYIPQCEAQPSEAVRTNVDGTRSVMDAARLSGVKRCAIISSDKAAAPINTYGITKAITERLVFETREYPAPSGTEFVAARYGNVIGSTGSVWPVFKEQYAHDMRVSVTDPNMTRFFTPAADAVNIVLTALLEAPASTVVVQQPRTMRIGDLAEHVTRLWGALEPRIVGLRPGEKSHEAMAAFNEFERMTPFPQAHGWLLHGTTARAPGEDPLYEGPVPTGMTSDDAARMSAEEFVEAAVYSEAI